MNVRLSVLCLLLASLLVHRGSGLVCKTASATETCSGSNSSCFSSQLNTGAAPTSATFALSAAAAFTAPANGCHNSTSLSFFGNLTCSNGTQANLISLTGGGFYVYICCSTDSCNTLSGSSDGAGADGDGDGGVQGPGEAEEEQRNVTEFTVQPPRGKLETLNLIIVGIIGFFGVAGGVAVDLAQRGLWVFSDG